jgi:hypothetical protein
MMSRNPSDSILPLLPAFTYVLLPTALNIFYQRSKRVVFLKKLSSCGIDTKSISVDLKKSWTIRKKKKLEIEIYPQSTFQISSIAGPSRLTSKATLPSPRKPTF